MTLIQKRCKKLNMPGKFIEKDECVTQYAQQEIYKFYKDKIRELGPESVYNVPQGVVGGIQGDFNKAWMQEIVIGKGLIFRLPYRLGDIICKKIKTKLRLDWKGNIITRSLPVDWYKSKQRWAEMWPGLTPKELKEIKGKPLIYILNEHSDGYRYQIIWDRARCVVKNKKVYNFVPNRANHRYLAQVVKSPTGRVDYYEIKPRKWKKRRN